MEINALSSKNIVIWGGWYGSKNVGDQILLLSITDILQQHLHKNLRFTVLTDNATWVQEYTAKESAGNIIPLQSRREIHRVIRAIYGCDLFMMGGGVPFFDQKYHLMVMGFLFSLVHLFKKPTLLWSVSSQVIHSNYAYATFRWVLSKANAITYRDEHTRMLFSSCHVNDDRMSEAPDPGFLLEWEDDLEGVRILQRAGVDPDARPLFGLTPRTLRGEDGEAVTHYAAKSPKQYNREIECFATALDWLWEKGYQPVFIPMNTIHPDDDRLAAREIIQRANHGDKAFVVNESVRPRIAPLLYHSCIGSFVSRVHGGVTSMLGNCPMMMYSFDPKYVGIMEMMNMSEYCITEDQATPDRTMEILKNLVERREKLQERLATKLHELQRQATIPAQQVADILGCEFKPV